MEQNEIVKLQTYMRARFGNDTISLRQRKETGDSVEVHLGSEFIGLIYKDDEDGDVSYDFNMAILAIDLPATP